MQLCEKNDKLTTLEAQPQGVTEAAQALDDCVKSIEGSMKRLKVAMPQFVNVSSMYFPFNHMYVPHWPTFLVRRGYQATMSKLVEITRDIVQKELKNDAWLMWAIAQRVSLPVKIDACIEYVTSFFIPIHNTLMICFHKAKALAVGVVSALFCRFANSSIC